MGNLLLSKHHNLRLRRHVSHIVRSLVAQHKHVSLLEVLKCLEWINQEAYDDWTQGIQLDSDSIFVKSPYHIKQVIRLLKIIAKNEHLAINPTAISKYDDNEFHSKGSSEFMNDLNIPYCLLPEATEEIHCSEKQCDDVGYSDRVDETLPRVYWLTHLVTCNQCQQEQPIGSFVTNLKHPICLKCSNLSTFRFIPVKVSDRLEWYRLNEFKNMIRTVWRRNKLTRHLECQGVLMHRDGIEEIINEKHASCMYAS